MKSPAKLLLLSICLLNMYCLVAQNFIPNGSFESYALCPQSRNDGRLCDNWNAPTRGTSDYFNTCAPNSQVGVSVPDNFAGSQSPRTGNAYSGIYASLNFTDPFLEYREYMQVTLDSLLIAGGKYTFTMYLSLADRSNYASNKMGAYISKIRPSSNSDRYLNVVPQILSTTYITDKTGWVKVTGEYIATGGEKYITIGVFEPAATHTRITVSGGSSRNNYNGVSYYYIDDVSLTRACDLPSDFLSDTTACVVPGAPFLISAADTMVHAYLWNTGETSKSINAPQSGKYVIRVSSFFCSVYDTITVTRNPIPVVNLGPDLFICGDVDTLLSSNNTGKTYLWNTGALTESIRVSDPGDYAVRVTDNGCNASDTISVFASPVPVFRLGNDTASCFQTTMLVTSPITADNYLWNTGSTQPGIIINKAGTYWLEINKDYCTVRDSISITQKKVPLLDLGPDRKICKEQAVKIDVTQAEVSYFWEDGNLNGERVVSAPGVFAVTVLSDDGCEVSDSLVLDTFVSPVINLGADTAICKNNEITLGVPVKYAVYRWQNGSTASTYTTSSAGVYSLEVTDGNGCKTSDNLLLKTLALPVVELTSELKICDPDTFVTVSGNFSSVLWNDGSSDTQFPVNGYGTFTVTATDENNCSNTASITVLNNCPGKVFVPNVFTPSNKDGVNDVFYPVTRNIETLTFEIFNRWGEKVFETNKLQEGWNGYFLDKPAQADVYVYTVQYKTFSGVMGSTSGNVTLLK